MNYGYARNNLQDKHFISGVCIIYFPFPRISNSQIATIICSARRKQKWEEMQERKRMEAEALRSKQYLFSIAYPFHMINGTIYRTKERTGDHQVYSAGLRLSSGERLGSETRV